MALKFYNTLGRKKEEFVPINKDEVLFYSCGPTVNNYAHIGNLRAYVFADIAQKALEYSGYKVKRVMNITDIGIMSSDADTGEDKMTAALVREGKGLTLKNMRELAEFYTEKFKGDLQKLNIEIPKHIYFASDYVKEDVELVEKLEAKGYAYKTSDGLYFDTAKMPDYGILTGGKTARDENHARIAENPEKKNPEDFALWKFNSNIGYESPWGKGFPGWHIECSAIGIKFLGEQFDIHTGGIDLIPTHHTNEIAQSESATGKKPFVKFWIHSEHVDVGGAKMAKSQGNFLKLSSVIEKGIHPLTYRFWILMGSYRTKLNFNWEALQGAETALKRLYGLYIGLGNVPAGNINAEYQQKFKDFIEDDLDTPRGLVVLWDVLKDGNISDSDKKATVLDFDKVLGLGFENLKEAKKISAPPNILSLVKEREEARKNKDYEKSDSLRKEINSLGYEVKDTGDGQETYKM
ncbi:MAG TPA: cysteine--tRNA ligase [Candidatus Paceibacterota bacterium]|jgi:cysteinyl-tRNA synthetase|nr:cysteine--tRNA ligase [Candidatus Paceibacterota bacterium]